MRKIVRQIILIINVILAAFLILSSVSANISPADYWIFAFIALANPVFLIINALFILWWLVFRKWYFLLSLLCILLNWNALRLTVQVNISKPKPVKQDQALKLLTYNVRLFNYYQWLSDTMAFQKIIDFIHHEKPDIVCFQEFVTIPESKHDFEHLREKLKPLIYSHIYYTDVVPGKINFGMATFSKYPIVRKKMIEFHQTLNGSIASDLVVDKDTIRIYNCHLQSLRLGKDYNQVMDSVIFNYSDKHLLELKNITSRMRQAFEQRAGQVEIISENLVATYYPYIICGDFNDTPVSYAYHNLSRNMKDAFIESGSGTGTTFRGNIPYARIDYVLYSKGFHSFYYETKKVNWSDHYPVLAAFTID